MLFSKPSRRILSSSIARLFQPRFFARRILIPGAAILLLEGIATKGATYTWTNPLGGSWSNSTNWAGGASPSQPGDIADFSQLGLGVDELITLDANATAGALLFGDTGETYDTALANGAGGTWTLTLAASSGSPIVNVANDNATISAILAGTQGLTKTGSGNLVLTAANTYTGTTTVAGGTLTLDFSQPAAPASNIVGNTTPGNLALSGSSNLALVGNPSAANSQSFAGLTVGSGADTITLNQNGATGITLALNAITQTVGGTLNFPLAPNTNTLVVTTSNSNINGILGPWATVGSGSATEYATVNGSGDIVGYTGATTAAGTLATVNSATSNYVFTAAGTLTGSRTANTLQYNGTGTITALAACTLTLNGLLNTGSGTLTFSSTTGGIQIGSTNELIVQGGSVTIKAPISNNGSNASSLTYSGTGTLTLNTTASTYTGVTTSNSGTLTLGLANVLNSASSLAVNGGTVGISTFSQSVSGVTLTSGAINGTTGTLTSASAFNLQSGAVGVILNGSVAMNKTTFGDVTISKAATLGTSGVNIHAGTITLGVLNALTSGNNVTLGDSTANTGGTLDLHGFNQTIDILTAVGSGQNIVTNEAAAGSPSVLTLNTAATFSGSIEDGTGGVSLVKADGSTITLTGANTFTGGTTINNGTLVLAGGNNRLAPTGAISLGNSAGVNLATLELGNSSGAISQTAASIARTTGNTATGEKIVGGYYSAASPGTYSSLTVNYTNTSTPDTYVGLLGSGTVGVTAANNFALTKTGAGTLVLSPVGVDTYIAGTNVNGGTLALGASGALPSGSIVNLGGGTLDLAGFSSNVGAVTLTSGGIVDSVGGATLSGSSYLVESGAIGAVLGDGSSPGVLTKTTSGTVTLSGQNTYSGGTFIDGGTLTLGMANALPVTGAVTVAGGLLDLGGFSATVGTVTLTNGGIINSGGGATLTGSSYIVQSGAINAVLGGAGSTLTKTSSGTVTLTAANSYTGLTSINAGVLNVSSQQTGGGAFSVNDGSTLNVDLAAAGQSLATSSLTIGTSNGGALSFDLGTLGNPTAPVINAGSLTLNGVNILNISGGGLSVGQFPLIAYTGSIGGAGSFTLGTLPARITANLDFSTVPQEILLNITGYDIPHWTGTINGNWDVDDGTGTVGTLNWALSTNASTGYYQGGAVGTDSVLFDNTATGAKTVNLTTVLTPIAITVNNDNLAGDTYTFTGPGKLGGATTLTKLGNGTLILANTGGNDFSGTVTISSGVLQAGDGATAGAGQLGSGLIVITGGTLALDHPSGDDIALPNILSGGGTVTQQGADTVTVTGNNLGFSGAFDVNSGTLKLGSVNGLGAASVSVQNGANLDVTGYNVANALGLSGGTLESIGGTGASVTGPIALNGGGVVSVAASSTLNISGAIGGAGGLVSNGSGLLILSGNNNYSGVTAVNAGTLQLGNANALGGAADPTSIASGAILDIAGYSIAEPIQLNGGTLRSSTGAAGAVSGIVTLEPAGGTVDVPTGGTLTLSSTVTGGGQLTKTSAGTLVLSGSNSYNGGLALNAGVVEFADLAAVPAAGQVSLANGVTIVFGFDFDQPLLNNAIAPTFNTATIALAADDNNDLNFANVAGASLGAIGNVTYSGTLTPAFVNYYLGGGGGTLTFTSALTGGTNLIVGATGAGTVILTAADSFTGGTTITAGTLRLGNSAALGPAANPLIVNGTLDLNGYNLTVGSLSGSGLVTDNSSTVGTTLLTVNIAGSATYSGSIDNGANGRSITLVKEGAGSLLFNKPNGNNYSGGTVINGGTLEVRTNNAQVLPGGSNLTFTGTSLFRAGNNGTGAGSLTLGTLTFGAGEGTVQSDQEATGTTDALTFSAAPTRLAGATGDFTLLVATDPSKYKVVFTTVPTTGESLDGGIYYQNADFAAYDPAGYVRALSYGVDSNTINVALTTSQSTLGTITGKDVELDGTGNITDQGTDSVRTLKIAGANNLTLDPTATFTVSTGGILKTGGGTAIVGGGVELDTGGEGDLVVRTATASDILNIATAISSETADGVTASGSGTLELSGSNSFTGPINVLGGALQLDSAGGFGTSPDGIILQTGSVLDLTSFSTAKPIQVNSATLRSSTGTTGDATGSVVLNGSDTFDVAQNATLNVDGTISGSGTLTKTSLGTAKLTAANTFTGNITITSGTILITNSQALGIGPKTVTIANALRPSLAIDGSGGSVSLDPSISFLTSSDGTVNTSGAIVNVAGNNVINGLITVNSGGGGDSDINVQAGSLTLAGGATAATAHALILDGPASGVVSGLLSDGAAALSLTKQGTGTWLVEDANTYSGATAINAGTLQINSIAATNLPQPLGETTTPVTLGTATTSGTLEYTGTIPATLSRGITVNGVAGGIVKNSGGALLTLSGSLSTTGRPLTLTGGAFDVTGSITGPAANSSLTVSNATVTLAGTSNTYNGPTTVTSGTLIVSGSISGTTSLAVNSGGVLSGDGTIATTNGNVTVASGGILAPGNDAPLTLSLGTGVLDLSAAAGGTGYLQFELGVNSDEVVLNSGSLNIGSGLLTLNDFSFTNAGGFAPGTYVLFNTGSPIAGSLGANLSGQVIGLNASLSIGNGGDSLVLNVVPEPGVPPALFAGVGALVGLQRFRRRSRAPQNFSK